MPSSNPQMAAQTYSPNSIHTRQPYKTKINKVCSMCKSDKSPQWRRGPSGDKRYIVVFSRMKSTIDDWSDVAGMVHSLTPLPLS